MMAIEQGVSQGQKVGNYVIEKIQTLKEVKGNKIASK